MRAKLFLAAFSAFIIWALWPEQETKLSALPPHLEGNWFNVTRDGPQRLHLRLTTTEIVMLNADGYTASRIPWKIAMRGEALRINCRDSSGAYSVLTIHTSGADLISVQESVPTGTNDDSEHFNLGQFARTPTP